MVSGDGEFSERDGHGFLLLISKKVVEQNCNFQEIKATETHKIYKPKKCNKPNA